MYQTKDTQDFLLLLLPTWRNAIRPNSSPTHVRSLSSHAWKLILFQRLFSQDEKSVGWIRHFCTSARKINKSRPFPCSVLSRSCTYLGVSGLVAFDGRKRSIDRAGGALESLDSEGGTKNITPALSRLLSGLEGLLCLLAEMPRSVTRFTFVRTNEFN